MTTLPDINRCTAACLLVLFLVLTMQDIGSQAQSLSHVAPSNSPLTGGTSITISGISLGNNADQPSPTVILGTTWCSTTAFVSFTSITCQVPQGIGGPATLQYVRADSGWTPGAAGTPVLTNGFTYDGPAITSVSPTNTPNSGGASVTVYGLNFAAVDFSATTKAGETVCATTSWQSATSFSCHSVVGTGNALTVVTEVETGFIGTAYKAFSYDAPTITEYTSTNSPGSAATTVTIRGFNFGVDNPSATITLSGLPCTTTVWVSGTQAACVVPDGAGAGLAFSFTVDGVRGAGGQFTYDSPIVSYTRAENGASSGASLVTIRGTNFASLDLTVTAKVGLTACTTSAWTTASSVTCAVAAGGDGTGLHTTLVVNSVMSTQLGSYSFDAPVLTHLADSNAPVTAGATVTISGSNFQAVDTSSTVKIGSTLCVQKTWKSDSSVTCVIPPGAPVEGVSATMELNNVVGTGLLAFTYDGPVITDAIPNNGPTSGEVSVTISGTNFGSSDSTMTVAISGSAWYPEGPCKATQWFSETRVICTSAGGAGASISVYVTTQGVEFRQINVFSFDAPTLTVTSHNNGPTTDGTSITLLGTNFGVLNRSPAMTVGGTACATTSWTSTTQLTCLTADGYGNGHDLIVNVRDLIGTVASTFSYDIPVISMVSNTNSPITAGTTITYLGTNFATSNTSPTAKIGTTTCASTSWTSVTSVACDIAEYYPVISSGADQPDSKLLVSLVAGGQNGCVLEGFTYDLPVITDVINPNAPASSGSSITVTGLNFGSIDNSVTVLVGESGCATSSWGSSTSLSCLTASGVGAPLNVNVRTADLLGTGYLLFSYSAPVVSIINHINGATTAGISVTVTGINFGINDYTVTARFGNTACATSSWTTDSTVHCLVAAGAGKALRATITAGLTAGHLDSAWTYDSPVVTDVTPDNAPHSTGTAVTVVGTNFAAGDETPSVGVGGTLCGTTSWSAVTTLTCHMTSHGWADAKRLNVFLGSDGTKNAAFTYDSPVLSQTEFNGPTSGGFSVTVSGVNFGFTELSASVTVGKTLCSTASWNSGTSVACLSASGTNQKLLIGLTAATVVGTANHAFTFDSPTPTALARWNGVTSAGSSLTVLGFNFAVTDITPTVFIEGTICGTVSWSTNTAVKCLTASGSGRAQLVTMFVGSLVGTLSASFTYNAPVVSHVRSMNAPTTSGALISIQGHNFAPSDYTVSAYVGATGCATSSWLTQTAVFCQTNHGTGKAAALIMGVSVNVGTYLETFTYDAPTITQTTPNGPMSSNHFVTLVGTNFGFGDVTPSAKLMPTMCASTSWSSATTVSCFQVGTVTNPTDANLRLGQLNHHFSLTMNSVVGTATSVFSFDSSVITGMMVPNAPLSSQTTVTMQGFNFAAVDLSPTAQLGSTQCEQSIWVAMTAIRCLVPAGSGREHSAILTLDSVLSTGFLAFSYDSPVVTFVNPWNAPTTTGSSVTISGTNFGSTNLTPSISVGGSQCATSVWTSTSRVLCKSPSGKGVAKALSLTITSLAGTGAAAFTYDAPILTHVTLMNAPTLGGSTVSIVGTNFGHALALLEKPPASSIGITRCTTMEWISTTTATCATPPGIGLSRTNTLTVGEIVGSMTQQFSYDASVITYTSTNAPTSGGASVTVLGLNFGSEDGSVSASIVDSRGSKACLTSSWVTTSLIMCLNSPGTGLVSSLSVSIAEVVGSVLESFTFDAPVLTSTSANAPTTGKAGVTIQGTNFGTNPSLEIVRDPRLGNTQCEQSKWQSDSSIVCIAAEGYGHTITQTLTIDKLLGTRIASFTFDAPSVTHVARPNAPTSTGASITIMGNNFVSTDTSGTIRLGKTMCMTSSWTTNTQMMCLSPPGTGAGYRVSMTIDELVGTQIRVFSFGAPVVTFINSFNAATSGGTIVTITGKNFGYSDVSATVSIGTTFCKRTDWVSTTSLSCLAGSGVGNDMLVAVNLDSQLGTKVSHFSYDAPVVTYTQGVSNGPLKSGTDVTILGFNFAMYGDKTGTVQVRVGGSSDSKNGVQWISPTSLVARTPNGSGSAVEIAVVVGSNIGTLSAAFTFDSPIIDGLIGANAAVTGGAVVTFTGRNFGTSDTSATARIGGSACSLTSWLTDSSVLCRAVPGAGAALAGTLEVNSVIGTRKHSFTYSAPVVTRTLPSNAPTTAGSVITIVGFNFGKDGESVVAQLGGVDCAKTSFFTDTSVFCTSGNGQGADISTGVSLNSVMGTGFRQFTFDSPVLTATLAPNSPTTGGGVLTVLGLNFGSGSADIRVGATICQSTKWTAATSAQCVVPSGMQVWDRLDPKDRKTGLPFSLSVGSVVGTGAREFTYDSPVLSVIAQANVPITAGTTVTITGSNFGDGLENNLGHYQGRGQPLSAKIGVSECQTTVWSSDSAIMCQILPGNGNGYSLTLTAGQIVGASARTALRMSYDTPVLTNFATTNAPPSGSSTMTINGFNFGHLKGERAEAVVGTTACATSVWISRTTVECHVSRGLNRAQDVSLNVRVCPHDEPACTNPKTMRGVVPTQFSYDCPVVTHFISPQNGLPRDGLATVTLSGVNFGLGNELSPSASIGPTECVRTTWMSESSLSCTTPRSGGSEVSQLDVSVRVGECQGALHEIAFFEDSNQFNPFDTTAPENHVAAPTKFLACGPDRDDEYTGSEIVTRGSAVLIPGSGVELETDGILVSATGDGEVYQKLLSLPLSAFDSREATYSLTAQVAGDFNLALQTGDSNSRSDIIMGIGNTEQFFGVRKADRSDLNIAYLVQGSYSDLTDTLQLDTTSTRNFGAWKFDIPNRQDPTAVSVRFRVRKQMNSQLLDMTTTVKHGDDLGEVITQNFHLPSGEAGYEFVIFRQNKRQTFKIKALALSLCGCSGQADECLDQLV